METLTVNSIQKMVLPNNNWKLIDACRANLKDGRETLTFLHVMEGGILEVTDGRILVQSKFDIQLPKGVYKVIAANKHGKTMTELTLEIVDVVFPNTAQVTPAETEESITLRFQKKEVHAGSIIKIYNFTGSAVSEKYLEIIGELDTNWRISKTEKERALRMYSEAYETLVIVMPICLKV